jgi:imidazolonepropionase-like amidohydrolase
MDCRPVTIGRVCIANQRLCWVSSTDCAAIEKSEKAGRASPAHAIGNLGAKNAVRAGVDSIEHGCYLDDEAIDMMLERSLFLVPTLAAVYHIIEAGTESGVPAFAVEKAKRANDAHLDSFRRARKAGVPMATGNDGAPPNRSDNPVSELERIVAAGMSPSEALVAAHNTDTEPLADISAVRQVHMVIKAGQIV